MKGMVDAVVHARSQGVLKAVVQAHLHTPPAVHLCLVQIHLSGHTQLGYSQMQVGTAVVHARLQEIWEAVLQEHMHTSLAVHLRLLPQQLIPQIKVVQGPCMQRNYPPLHMRIPRWWLNPQLVGSASPRLNLDRSALSVVLLCRLASKRTLMHLTSPRRILYATCRRLRQGCICASKT